MYIPQSQLDSDNTNKKFGKKKQVDAQPTFDYKAEKKKGNKFWNENSPSQVNHLSKRKSRK